MDRRRAAGALLALAVCIASSEAAPTASNQTALDLYDGGAEGCYYNFQHYGEGDRIMTNEPCLNCTCHNRMLMCYLRVCPFTKPIGQDCTVEKRADQCCPIVTCPDVPVDLLTSTSTTSPAEYGGTGVGKLDKYGCSMNGKYFPEGSKVPPTPNKPCEHCYCIRNMTTCVMQECTLHVDGCTPIYHKDVCCPVRYSCDHPEDEILQLDDMTTTVRPTPGFLLTTTTLSPVTQMSQDCVHEDRIVPDGALIKTEKACEHCYCMKGDIVCVVQECGTPMENEGKNCTSLPPREGQCCPDTYICEGDEIPTELPSEIPTEPSPSDELITLTPPRRNGVEGSGYRKETDESYTEVTPLEPDTEGSGYDHEITTDTDNKQTPEVTYDTTDDSLYITSTAKTPILEEIEKTTEPDKGLNTVPSDEETFETPMSQKTTATEEVKFTETSTLSADKKDEFDISSPETTEKQDQTIATTEPIFKKEDEIDVVTGMIEHSEAEKISTAYAQPITPTTPLFEHVTSGVDTETPLIDDNENKLTTNLYTSKYEPSEDSEMTTQSFIEMATSAETIRPPSDVGSGKTTNYYEATTQSLSEATTSAEITKAEASTETDIITQEEVTTESLSESPTSSRIPYDDHTIKEIEATTQDNIEFSSSTTANELPDHSSDVTVIEKKITTEPTLELSTSAELAKPSEEDSIDKTTREKEATTESSLETFTSTENAIVSDDVSSDSTIQEKEASTETSLETSSYAATTNILDTTVGEEIKEDKEVTTESPLQLSTSIEESKPSESSENTMQEKETSTEPSIETTRYEATTETSNKIEGEGIEITTESLLKPSDKVTKPAEISTIATSAAEESLSTTEKISSPETTSIDNKENEVEDSARIPGEGDCLVNSITYRNNSEVPSTSNCHTGCICVSSIVKCDPIICSPPPEYMDNCQPTYDSPDSCCPTYICHSGETMPPQPDSHMSGTEKPVTSSTFECHGDQCIIKQDSESPAPSEEPDSHKADTEKPVTSSTSDCHDDQCLVKQDVESPAPSNKPEVSECGSTSCGDDVQAHTSVPSVDKISSGCDGKECLPPDESCVNGNCEGTLPVQTCEGNNCAVEPIIVPVKDIPLCQDENGCKPQAKPCEGNECVNIDCSTSDCSPSVISPPSENEPKPEDEAKLPCPDGSCRRKETGELENQVPVDCTDSTCDIQKPDVVSTEKVDIQTEVPNEDKLPEIVTEKTQEEEEESKYPKPTEPVQLPVEQDEQVSSSESYNPAIEQSTPKSDTPNEISPVDVGTTAGISESSAVTTEAYLTTETPEEKITHSEPTSIYEGISSAEPSITESQPLEETSQTEEEVTTPSHIVPDISERIETEGSSRKPSEEPVTIREEIVTDNPIAIEPEVPKATTESQESPVTESQESTTNVEAEPSEKEKQDTSTQQPNVPELPLITTIAADKEITELDYHTPEPQADIQTTEKIEEITVKVQEEKGTTTNSATAQFDKDTTTTELSSAEPGESSTHSQKTDLQHETESPLDEHTDEQTSVDMTTSETPHEMKDDKTESATAGLEVPNVTESESDIIPTEATEKEQSTVQESVESSSESKLPDILSTLSTIQEEKETETLFTNKPFIPLEEKTNIPDITIPDQNIDTINPEINTEKQSEPSEMPVTTSYEIATPSKEVTDEKQEDSDTTKEGDSSNVTTEIPLIEQNKETEYAVVSTTLPTPSTAQDVSSSSEAAKKDTENKSSEPPEQDQATNIPLETTEVGSEKDEGSTSEMPEKVTSLAEKIGTEQPHADISENETAVTEGLATNTMQQSTEPQPTSVSVTEEVLRVSDKTEKEEGTTEESSLFKEPEIFTTVQTSEEPSKTTSIPVFTQQNNEISQSDYQPTISEQEKEEAGPTESTMQAQTEMQDLEIKTPVEDSLTPSTEEPIVEEQPSKGPIDYPVTESELLTEVTGQFVTKEEDIIKSPEKDFTAEDSDTTKVYTEEELVTSTTLLTGHEEKYDVTTETSKLVPNIIDQETKEPSLTTIASTLSDAVKETMQPDITSFETSTKSAEVTESIPPNIPESHTKDEDQESQVTVTTISDVPTSSIQEQSPESPHPTMSELQTEELLEVTKKPHELITEVPQDITTPPSPYVTQDIHHEISTDSPLEATTLNVLEVTSEVPHDKETEHAVPQDILTEEPQVKVTPKYDGDTTVEPQTQNEEEVKEVTTEKLQEPSMTDRTVQDEESPETVTVSPQDTATKAAEETSEDELKKTQSAIELTTQSTIIDRDNVVSTEPEVATTSASQEKTPESVHETVSEIEPSVTTTAPESIDTKYGETSEVAPDLNTVLLEEMTTPLVTDTESSPEIDETSTKSSDQEVSKTSEPKYEITDTTPYVVELEEHTHKTIEETSTILPDEQESTKEPAESHAEIPIATEQENEHTTTSLPIHDVSQLSDEESEKATPSSLPTEELIPQTTPSETSVEKQDEISSVPTQSLVPTTSEPESPVPEIEVPLQTEKSPSVDTSQEISTPEEQILPVTSRVTTSKIEEDVTTLSPEYTPETKPAETKPQTIPETPKPELNEVLPTDETPEDDGHFPPSGGPSGYGQEPDYVEEDQAFGPGTCRYGGKVYVSAQQIPRDDPCDFCFCFRSDIICLQQSCPPPIHGCHEEPIQGFCCPRYECPVAMATSVNVTTTTTTTTTTLPPHFLPHAYKGAAQRRGCQIKGHTYKVGEVVRASSGPCLHCTCGGDGQMKCDPKACTPEPMLRQMIAAAVSAKRRR